MRQVYVGSAVCGETAVRFFLLDGGPDACGVRVEMGAETAEAPDLSPSRARVRELLDRMCRGVVTPVAVRDVVEDWLAE